MTRRIEDEKKLRIGLFLDSLRIPLWKLKVIEQLIDSSYAQIALIVLCKKGSNKESFFQKIKNRWCFSIFKLYIELDKKMFDVKPRALELADSASLLKHVPTITIEAISDRYHIRVRDKDVKKIKDHDLDVLVNLVPERWVNPDFPMNI